MLIVKYADLVNLSFYELKGNITKDVALELLEEIGVFTSNANLINSLK